MWFLAVIGKFIHTILTSIYPVFNEWQTKNVYAILFIHSSWRYLNLPSRTIIDRNTDENMIIDISNPEITISRKNTDVITWLKITEFVLMKKSVLGIGKTTLTFSSIVWHCVKKSFICFCSLTSISFTSQLSFVTLSCRFRVILSNSGLQLFAARWSMPLLR